MDGITQRLNEIKNYYNLSGAKFADKVGKVKNTFANYLNGAERQYPFGYEAKIL